MTSACVEGLASARKILEPPAAPLPFLRLLPIARKFLETFYPPYISKGQEAYFDQRAGRAAWASQTTPNNNVPFINYKKVSRLRWNYPQNALFPTLHIGGKVLELTGTHRNSPGTTPGTHPGTHPRTSLVYYLHIYRCIGSRHPRWGGEYRRVRKGTCQHRSDHTSLSLSHVYLNTHGDVAHIQHMYVGMATDKLKNRKNGGSEFTGDCGVVRCVCCLFLVCVRRPTGS